MIFCTSRYVSVRYCPSRAHAPSRHGYVLAGTLRVTNTETGEDREYEPGDLILEAVGQWHKSTKISASSVARDRSRSITVSKDQLAPEYSAGKKTRFLPA